MHNFPEFSGMSVMEQAVIWEFNWNTNFPVISEEISCAAALPWRPGLQKTDTIQSIQSLLHVSGEKANCQNASSYFQRPFPHLLSPDVFSTCLAWHHSYTWASPPQFTDKVNFILSFKHSPISCKGGYNFEVSLVSLWLHIRITVTMRTTVYHTWKG